MKLIYDSHRDRYELFGETKENLLGFANYLRLVARLDYNKEEWTSIEEYVSCKSFDPEESMDIHREEEEYLKEYLQIKEEDDRVYSFRYRDNDKEQRKPVFEEQQAGSYRPLGQA